jgi:hypothetical protein
MVPVGVGLVAVSMFIAVLAVTRPDERGASHADALAPAASPARAITASPTVPVRTPSSVPTATPTRAPVATPVAPTPAAPAGQSIGELSYLRFVDTVVIENGAGADVFFPPGMPMEVLVGRNASGEFSFFFLPPPPFVAMNATATPGFCEQGVTGTAIASGRLGPEAATFTFEFELSEAALHGTLRITGAAGQTLLVLGWSGN